MSAQNNAELTEDEQLEIAEREEIMAIVENPKSATEDEENNTNNILETADLVVCFSADKKHTNADTQKALSIVSDSFDVLVGTLQALKTQTGVDNKLTAETRRVFKSTYAEIAKQTGDTQEVLKTAAAYVEAKYGDTLGKHGVTPPSLA